MNRQFSNKNSNDEQIFLKVLIFLTVRKNLKLMKFYLIPARMAIIGKTNDCTCWQRYRKRRGTLFTTGGNVN